MFSKTVKYKGDAIFIQPFCDFFGIAYKHQRKKINQDPILSKEMQLAKSVTIFDDERERIALSKLGFVRWIQILSPASVKGDLSSRLIEFQRLIIEYIYGTFGEEERIRDVYKRRDKADRLYKKILKIKQDCDKEIQDFHDRKYLQTKLDFPEDQKRESLKIVN